MSRELLGCILRSLPSFFSERDQRKMSQNDYISLIDDWAGKLHLDKRCGSREQAKRMLMTLYGFQQRDMGVNARCTKYFEAMRYCHDNEIHSLEAFDRFGPSFAAGLKGPRGILISYRKTMVQRQILATGVQQQQEQGQDRAKDDGKKQKNNNDDDDDGNDDDDDDDDVEAENAMD